LVGGIYTADPEKLSLAATLPRFGEMERRSGSLLAAALESAAQRPASEAAASGARYSLFVAPRGGMSSLAAALAARLPAGAVQTDSPVERVEPAEGRWRVHVSRGGPLEVRQYDALIVTTPSPAAARLVEGFDGRLAAELRAIEYAGASIVVAVYRREQIASQLDSFGFVVPAAEKRRVLAASFSSLKYPGRAPEGQVLVRVFVGGATQPELANLPDDELRRLVREELADLLGAQGEPLLWHIARWHGAMPQYHVGHLEKVGRIERLAAAHPNLALAGSAYRGVGVPMCIHSGEAAAESVLRQLAHSVLGSVSGPRSVATMCRPE
jgi:oxygen-dependent protoporphyrinogen oxidase